MSATAPASEPEKSSSEKNSHGNTPAEQNSVIPLAWKQSKAEPVPVVRCVQIKKDGERCGRWSIRGYHKCKRHSGPGALMPDGNVSKYAAAVIEAARLRLVDSADEALDVLQELWSNPGTSEGIRLKAAESVLDRAGIRGGYEVDVIVEERDSPVDELKKRITELKKGAEARARMQAGEYDDDVVDAEIIEDEQPALFDLDDEDTDDQER